MREMMFFLKMSEREQRVRLSQNVPSVEDYRQCRMGTSAMGVISAIHE